MKQIVPGLLALLMLMGAVGHVFWPDIYYELIPDVFPKVLINYSVAVAELLVGIGLWLPKYRSRAGLSFMILMILFTPIHIWELFREDPMIGSRVAAAIRLLVQFLLIYAGWWVYRKWLNG